MRPRQPLSWFVFVLSALVGNALFCVPAFIIWPFRRQTQSALALALALRQHAPWGTLACFLLCLIFAFVLWQADNLPRKLFIGAALALVAISGVMSRLNYFEWMFHPVDNPRFESESASRLATGEMILAVRFGSEARAYPIREMAYHHVLNDVVAGVPIAVTY